MHPPPTTGASTNGWNGSKKRAVSILPPCFDADGTWAPSESCKDFPDPEAGGRWDSCDPGKASEWFHVCGDNPHDTGKGEEKEDKENKDNDSDEQSESSQSQDPDSSPESSPNSEKDEESDESSNPGKDETPDEKEDGDDDSNVPEDSSKPVSIGIAALSPYVPPNVQKKWINPATNAMITPIHTPS